MTDQVKPLTKAEKTKMRKKWGITSHERKLLDEIRKENIEEDDTHYLDTPIEYREDADEMVIDEFNPDLD